MFVYRITLVLLAHVCNADGKQLLDACLAHPLLNERSAGRAHALNALAMMVTSQQNAGRPIALQAEALSIFRGLDDRAGMAAVLATMYNPLMLVGALSESIARCEEAYTLCRELDDAWMAGRIQRTLGQLAMHVGNHAKAARLLEDSRVRARTLGDDYGVARASHLLALLASEWSSSPRELMDALRLAEESVRLTRDFGDLHNLPVVLLTAGDLRRREGDLAGAARLFEEAQAITARTGDRVIFTCSLGCRATLARQRGDFPSALGFLDEALNTAIMTDVRRDLRLLIRELAMLARDLEQPERAARLLGAADTVQRSREDVVPEPERVENDADLRMVQDALGVETFALAWHAGQAMTDTDILAEATALRAAVPAKPESAAATGLSARELDILERMAAGLSNQQIADQLYLSLRTITTHVTNIHTKLGVDSRTAAVAYAIRAGLV